jgi:hypothetical protein
MAAERVSPPVPKAVAGFLFLLFWAVAIVAWCLVNVSNEPGPRGLIADIGIVFACAGTAGLFVATRAGFTAIFVLSVIGAALFVLGDLTQAHLLVYFLRIMGPAIAAVILPTLKLVSGIRVLS